MAQSNLLEELHAPIVKKSGDIDFLGSGFGVTQKKEVNLMHGFSKHGDLI